MSEHLGKYEVVRELGRGGMGVVYEGRDPETGERTAIKVLPAQLALDPVFRQRFVREVKTLERLEHENIVRICDSGHHEGALWYAMDFVDGTDLEHLLKGEGKIDPLRATRMVRGVALALAYSHVQNIIHRDIKPANIMLTEDDTVKLTDFGIARMVDATRMTATAGVLGTVEYMSPEQADGVVVDERADIYSLGVTYYRAVTGKMPVEGANPTEIMIKIQRAQIDAPKSWVPDLPRNVNDLIMQMVEKDRSKRVLSAQALLRELERIIKQLEAAEAGEVVSEEAILEARPPAWWLNPWLVTLVLLIVVVGGWKLLRRPPPAGPIVDAAEKLMAEDNQDKALSMLNDVLNRRDLKSELRVRGLALQKTAKEYLKATGLASRVWLTAKLARRQGRPLVELKLILILLEEVPDTKQGGLAKARLADSVSLQRLLKKMRPESPFLEALSEDEAPDSGQGEGATPGNVKAVQ